MVMRRRGLKRKVLIVLLISSHSLCIFGRPFRWRIFDGGIIAVLEKTTPFQTIKRRRFLPLFLFDLFLRFYERDLNDVVHSWGLHFVVLTFYSNVVVFLPQVKYRPRRMSFCCHRSENRHFMSVFACNSKRRRLCWGRCMFLTRAYDVVLLPISFSVFNHES